MTTEFPTVPPYRVLGARDQDLLGMIFEAMGRLEAAEKACRQAAADEQRLVDEFPSMPDFRFSLALSVLRLDGICRKQGRQDDAETLNRRGLQLLEKLVADAQASLNTASSWPMR